MSQTKLASSRVSNRQRSNIAEPPPISVVVTLLNEVKTLDELLESLTHQTLPSSEIILIDGGSTDGSLALLERWSGQHPEIKIIEKKGNRSVGRNAGLSVVTASLVAITDAGCVPHSDWLEQLAQAWLVAANSNTVIAGYYDARSNTPFEEAVVPYALVMPDRVNPQTFLPATRSMLLPAKTWKAVGGFDERLSDNEDYDFARRLQAAGIPIRFAADAKVTWQPRATLAQFWTMIYRFARGDAFAGLWRPKVALIFGRYIFGTSLLALGLIRSNPIILMLVTFGLVGYSLWSVQKNLKYTPTGWYWLPVLQLVSDLAVMAGTVEGMLKRSTANVRI